MRPEVFNFDLKFVSINDEKSSCGFTSKGPLSWLFRFKRFKFLFFDERI